MTVDEKALGVEFARRVGAVFESDVHSPAEKAAAVTALAEELEATLAGTVVGGKSGTELLPELAGVVPGETAIAYKAGLGILSNLPPSRPQPKPAPASGLSPEMSAAVKSMRESGRSGASYIADLIEFGCIGGLPVGHLSGHKDRS